jgi:DNA-binding transcriptional LysR family regulator
MLLLHRLGPNMQFSDRVARRMKLHDLRILMAVAEAGSMNKAAAILNMTQPAVSRSIAELERTVGVSLLDRNARGVEPTAYGRALLGGGTAVFDDLRQALKDIEFLADPTTGEVRLGCSAILAETFVSAVIDRLFRRYPRVTFELVTAQVETLHRNLHERSVDLLVARRFGPIWDERLNFETLFDESFVVVAGKRHPRVRWRRIVLADLAEEAWVLPPPASVVGSVAREAFRASGIDYPRVTVLAVPAEVLISLAATGSFVTIIPASTLRFAPKRPEVKVLPVELPTSRIPVGIVTLKNRMLSPAVRRFVQYAREVAKPLGKRK